MGRGALFANSASGSLLRWNPARVSTKPRPKLTSPSRAHCGNRRGNSEHRPAGHFVPGSVSHSVSKHNAHPLWTTCCLSQYNQVNLRQSLVGWTPQLASGIRENCTCALLLAHCVSGISQTSRTASTRSVGAPVESSAGSPAGSLMVPGLQTRKPSHFLSSSVTSSDNHTALSHHLHVFRTDLPKRGLSITHPANKPSPSPPQLSSVGEALTRLTSRQHEDG